MRLELTGRRGRGRGGAASERSLGSRGSGSCAQAPFTCGTAWGRFISTLSQMRVMLLQSLWEKPPPPQRILPLLSCEMHNSKAVVFAFGPLPLMPCGVCIRCKKRKSLYLQSTLRRCFFSLSKTPLRKTTQPWTEAAPSWRMLLDFSLLEWRWFTDICEYDEA